MSIYDELKIKIDSLAIFSSVKDDPAVAALRRLLDANSVAAYSEFIELLYPIWFKLPRIEQLLLVLPPVPHPSLFIYEL